MTTQPVKDQIEKLDAAYKAVIDFLDEKAKPDQDQMTQNKYQRKVKGVVIDVYDVLVAWEVTNPAVQHAIKKLLQPGQRGHKDVTTDLAEAGQSIGRAIEIEREPK